MIAGKNNLLHYHLAPKPAAVMGNDGRLQRTRLTLGSHFADIVPDYDGNVPVFHWIIQRVGSPEILNMGQEASFAYALDRAHECLEDLIAQNKSGGKQCAVFYEFGELK